jgi:hypothetical protein
MTVLRCWARRASDGALCEAKAKHLDPEHTWYGDLMPENACAPDAGTDGRETAALRLLEVSHELDRDAFRRGAKGAQARAIRKVAGRLKCDVRYASGDLRDVEREARSIESAVARYEEASPDEVLAANRVIDCLALAADILRPWVEDLRHEVERSRCAARRIE